MASRWTAHRSLHANVLEFPCPAGPPSLSTFAIEMTCVPRQEIPRPIRYQPNRARRSAFSALSNLRFEIAEVTWLAQLSCQRADLSRFPGFPELGILEGNRSDPVARDSSPTTYSVGYSPLRAILNSRQMISTCQEQAQKIFAVTSAAWSCGYAAAGAARTGNSRSAPEIPPPSGRESLCRTWGRSPVP